MPHASSTLQMPDGRGYRIGTDLVEVSTIADSVRQFGARYLAQVFTQREIAYCEESPAECTARLAARFAAKEAVLKVLRPEGAWPAWRNIEIVRHPHGWCDIALHGTAATLADGNATQIISCSLSHEGSYASAVVLGFAHAVVRPQHS